GRLRVADFTADPRLERLVRVVPFGLDPTPPERGAPALAGEVPGIGADDRVLLWGGGIWNWFDPLTPIRAVAKLAERRTDVKLYFLGVKHPNPDVAEMEMAGRAVRLAEELGVRDRYAFFNFGWVPYEARGAYFSEAAIGVSSHFDNVETRFAF